MMSTFYRLQPASRDPQALLDPEQQVSRVWLGVVERPCGACHGTGLVVSEYRDDDQCPACDGAGTIQITEQRGVSCCWSLADLAAYFGSRDADLDDAVVVELEGELADDEDVDASVGGVLVIPAAITAIYDAREALPALFGEE